MAVAFRAVNGDPPFAGVTSDNPPAPAGQANGDLVITEIFINAAKTLSISAGWTILFQGNNGAITYGIGYKMVTSGTDRPTWSWAGAANTLGCNTWAFTGAYSAAPIGNHSHLTPTASTTTLALPAISITSNTAFVMSYNSVSNSNQVIPLPAGFTNVNSFNSAAQSERAASKAANYLDSVSTSVSISSATAMGSLIEIRSQAAVLAGLSQGVLIW